MNLLLASENLGNLILIIILLVACAGMFVLSYLKNKKYVQAQKEMQDKLEVGAKVLTKTFIYGTIEKITETTDGKIVLIKSGEGDKVSYLEMNVEAIYSIDSKEEVVDLDEVQLDSETDETEAMEVEEEKVVEPKKTTTRKTTKKSNKK